MPTRGYITESFRPRHLEVVLISNPAPERRLVEDPYALTKIYVVGQSTEVAPLTITAYVSTPEQPAYFCTSEEIWNEFSKKNTKGRKKTTIEDLIISAIIAISKSSGAYRIGDPSEFDITTVPFEKPSGNNAYDRFDAEFIAPLYKKAMDLMRK